MPRLSYLGSFFSFTTLFPHDVDGLTDIFFMDSKLTVNLKFVIITGSITTSLLSLAWSLTSTYFSKPGKESFKTFGRLAVLYCCIIFQVVPKIFAYQSFAFGVIGPLLGPNFIIPFLLLIPIIQTIILTIVFRIVRYFQREKFEDIGWKGCFANGLISIYVYLG